MSLPERGDFLIYRTPWNTSVANGAAEQNERSIGDTLRLEELADVAALARHRAQDMPRCCRRSSQLAAEGRGGHPRRSGTADAADDSPGTAPDLAKGKGGRMSPNPNIVDRLTVVCGKPDRKGCCKVVAQFDGVDIHHDQIPPFESYRRGLFAQAVRQKIGDRLCNGSRIPTPEFLEAFPGNADDQENLSWIGDIVVEAAHAIECDSESRLVPRIIMADQVESRPREWLWRNRIVLGGVNMLVGLPDHGKSLISLDIAAQDFTGRLLAGL